VARDQRFLDNLLFLSLNTFLYTSIWLWILTIIAYVEYENSRWPPLKYVLFNIIAGQYRISFIWVSGYRIFGPNNLIVKSFNLVCAGVRRVFERYVVYLLYSCYVRDRVFDVISLLHDISCIWCDIPATCRVFDVISLLDERSYIFDVISLLPGRSCIWCDIPATWELVYIMILQQIPGRTKVHDIAITSASTSTQDPQAICTTYG
jgi:hypothetical protein